MHHAIDMIRGEDCCKRCMGVMYLCRVVTPQFYINKTDIDVLKEKWNVLSLIEDIEKEVLIKMCEMSVCDFFISRGDAKCFNISYIMSFYVKAFNYVFCDSIVLPSDAKLIFNSFNQCSGVVYERYGARDGKIIEIREIKEKDKILFPAFSRVYSSRFTKQKKRKRNFK